MKLFLLCIFLTFPFLNSLASNNGLDFTVRCSFLDADYKSTEEYFMIRFDFQDETVKLVEAKSKLLTQIGTDNIFFPGHPVSGLTICKNPDMEDSTDFENSYQTCGVNLSMDFVVLERNRGLSEHTFEIQSFFNASETEFSDHTRTYEDRQPTLDFKNILRSKETKRIQRNSEIAELEAAEGKIGHIIEYVNGQFEKAYRIQCAGPRVDLVVKGANH